MEVIKILLSVIVSCLLCSCEYGKPVPVATIPLLSVPAEFRPQYAKDVIAKANKDGDSWGQCTMCGFPVTDSHVKKGWGSSVIWTSKGSIWNEYLCSAHIEKAAE